MQPLASLLIDKTQPLKARINAAEALSKESQDYDAWKALCSVIDAEGEEAALRCAAIRFLPEWNRFAAIEYLTRPYVNPEVRSTAIETLDKMGSAKGDREVMLLAQLAALRGTATDEYVAAALESVTGDLKRSLSMQMDNMRGSDEIHRSCSVIGLPQSWGREPRVLEFLKEELQRGDEQRRRDAVYGLCVLRELDPALLAAGDPSPMVRSHLASTLGSYREEAGVKVLQRLLYDSDPGVAKEAKTALRRLGKLEMPKPAGQPQRNSTSGRLLSEISRLRLSDPEVVVSVPDAKVISIWLGEKGATEEELTAAEQRLGTSLPPDYRAFLLESNGFEQLSSFIWRLYGTGEIDWFRIRNQAWIDAYQIGDDISPQEHLNQRDNEVRFRAAYLSSCLQISEEGDSAVVLLNPEVVTAAGEWETWFFANWLPGARRYSSFREFMEAELVALLNAGQ
jgi:SMI1 / KNR4 family (SUKH-1)